MEPFCLNNNTPEESLLTKQTVVCCLKFLNFTSDCTVICARLATEDFGQKIYVISRLKNIWALIKIPNLSKQLFLKRRITKCIAKLRFQSMLLIQLH